MSQYQEIYPIGTTVRTKDRSFLESFSKNWTYHHPLEKLQLTYASRQGIVATVGFYHGGDVLYTLESIPGIWHEACLELL